MNSYKTVQGDTWDIIAFKNYGAEEFMSLLIETNPRFADIVIFPQGCVLSIPDVDYQELSSLPPWKLD